MSKQFAIVIVSLLLLTRESAGQRDCQARFDSGEYKGMLSCSAFQYVELQDPFTVREAKGVVTLPNSKEGLPDVIFEIRTLAGTVVATKTDSRGRFRFKHLVGGTYKFKTTLNGYSSVMGTIILNKHADQTRVINIEMPVGV